MRTTLEALVAGAGLFELVVDNSMQPRTITVGSEVFHRLNQYKQGKSTFQYQCEDFMVCAGQAISQRPTLPPFKDRLRMAKLIHEEAMEVIAALGFKLEISTKPEGVEADDAIMLPVELTIDDECKFQTRLMEDRTGDIADVAHELTDLHVVLTCALSGYGLRDLSLQKLISDANLRKFGPGAHVDKDTGKWIKPPDFVPADVQWEVNRQSCIGTEDQE